MTELRQRKQESKEDSKDSSVVTSAGDTAEKYVDAVSSVAPAQLKPFLKQALPFVRKLAEFIEASIPVLNKIWMFLLDVWTFLKPYKPDLLLPAFTGIIMCFFGGYFVTLIAAAEAYKMCSHETIMRCFDDLSSEFNACSKSNKEDDQIDADGNGIADSMELTPNQLVVRKTALFFKTVNPKKITDAVAGLNSGLLAIIATLKLQFAKSITLGNSISALVLEGPAKKYIIPAIESSLHEDYQKWASPLVVYVVKSFAISLAWFLQRIVSAVHASLRGGKMAADNILDYLTIMGHLDTVQRASMKLDTYLAPALAGLGMWFQFSRAFNLPFPLNLLLMPFTVAEYFLMWMVNAK